MTKDIKMTYKIINIPEQYEYVNHFPDFKEDLPDNIYLDKTSTGCGATHAVITNDIDYVIAVPFISLGTNKVLQSEKDRVKYPHELFMVSGETLDTELRSYIARNLDKPKKILVTYDSLPKVVSQINPKDYKLFVDEGHKLIEYAGNFKPKVVQYILDNLETFRSFVICTATPTKEKYLPEKIKPIDKIKLVWGAGKPVHFNHIRVKSNQLRTSILALCLRFLRDQEEGNLYLYYNSVLSVAKISKDLVDNFGYTSDDIKIICANTDDNKKTLKRIGKGFRPRQAIEKDENGNLLIDNKRVTFVTSTAFEGQDFLDPVGKTYIVSDGKLDHTKLDIATQVSQIIGRLRDSLYKDNVTMIWTVAPTLGFDTIEAYTEYLEEEKKDVLDRLADFQNARSINTKRDIQAGTKTNPFVIDVSEEGVIELILNPDAMNHLLNVYEGTEQQYYVNIKDSSDINKSVNEHVECTLKDVFAGTVTSNYELPFLEGTDKLKIGQKGSFTSIASKYVQALINLNGLTPLPEQIITNSIEIKEMVESDSRYETLVEYIQLFGADQELVEGCSRTRAEDYLSRKIQAYKEKERLVVFIKHIFKEGDVYSNSELKYKISNVYKSQDIEGTPKASDINLAFKTIKTSYKEDGMKINALKLVEKL